MSYSHRSKNSKQKIYKLPDNIIYIQIEDLFLFYYFFYFFYISYIIKCAVIPNMSMAVIWA